MTAPTVYEIRMTQRDRARIERLASALTVQAGMQITRNAAIRWALSRAEDLLELPPENIVTRGAPVTSTDTKPV